MMEKKISKKALSRSFHHWYYGNLTCFTQEHMQTFGYLASMLPIVEDLYDNKEDQKRSMNTYTAFFNTEPQIGALVVGITAGLEEARANQSGEVDDETINGLRAGLMGPLAGIGDSLIVGTLIPILLGVSMGLSSGGSPIGAIFYIVVWNLLAYFGMKFAYYKGYELGGKAVEFLVGPVGNSLRKAIGCLGAMVIGAVAASWVPITTAISLKNANGKEYLNLQNQLDGVYPGLLTGVFIVFCWWLMAKKNISPIKVMLLLVVIAFLGVLCGFFNPGLKY
ncbi:MAG TPA: PTS fructose transporter subunit IID [Kandleria vitulina]|nr:PTS fructose transporter subunit IID [Kandleria vitulina]HAH74621.1 PTS fructose transporter subunit IID [Kandleria vitulina]HBG67304.1 PTS fructose transporter subunit IID [Kandleria vitulina]HCY53550.1 PTS fructose transporter subunit IID [Kandleria vitulina]